MADDALAPYYSVDKAVRILGSLAEPDLSRQEEFRRFRAQQAVIQQSVPEAE